MPQTNIKQDIFTRLWDHILSNGKKKTEREVIFLRGGKTVEKIWVYSPTAILICRYIYHDLITI